MTRLSIIVVVALATLSFTAASLLVELKKLEILEAETLITAATVRNVTIRTPQDKVQLVSMAVDFADGISYAIYTLNNAIPNVVNTPSYKLVAHTSDVLSDIVYEVEQAIVKDSEKLKEVLVKTLEMGHDLAIVFKNITPTSDFELNQIKRKHDYLIYTLYNLKLQALYFNTPNKELDPVIATTVGEFIQALKSLTIGTEVQDGIEQELRHALLHLSVITSKMTYKLQNWVELNPHRTADIAIVEEVAQLMSELHNKAVSAANINNKPSYMKEQLISLYGEGAKPVAGLLDIKYPDNLGGQEFIRSSIFLGLTIGRAYASNINTVTAKA